MVSFPSSPPIIFVTLKLNVYFGNAYFSIQVFSHNWGSWPALDCEWGRDQTLQETWLSSLFSLAFITSVNRKSTQSPQELEKNMEQNDSWSEWGITCVMLIHENVFQPPAHRDWHTVTMCSCTHVLPHRKLKIRISQVSSWRANL